MNHATVNRGGQGSLTPPEDDSWLWNPTLLPSLQTPQGLPQENITLPDLPQTATSRPTPTEHIDEGGQNDGTQTLVRDVLIPRRGDTFSDMAHCSPLQQSLSPVYLYTGNAYIDTQTLDLNLNWNTLAPLSLSDTFGFNTYNDTPNASRMYNGQGSESR